MIQGNLDGDEELFSLHKNHRKTLWFPKDLTCKKKKKTHTVKNKNVFLMNRNRHFEMFSICFSDIFPENADSQLKGSKETGKDEKIGKEGKF